MNGGILMSSQKIVTLTSKNFEEEVMKSQVPVLVDFWAPWCGPCRAVGPILDELADEMDGQFKIAKLNVDDEGEVAGKYRIMSIPTLMVFKNGEMVEKIIGAKSKSELQDLFKKHM